MSIGPQNIESVYQPSTLRQISAAAKNTVKAYFARPVYYLFYIGLACLLVFLLLGIALNWKFYSFLAILGLIEFYYNKLEKKIKIWIRQSKRQSNSLPS